jgi:hypothetical protein
MSIYDVANLPHFLIGDWRNGEYGTQWDPIRRFLEAALGLRGLRVVIKIGRQTGSQKIYLLSYGQSVSNNFVSGKIYSLLGLLQD